MPRSRGAHAAAHRAPRSGVPARGSRAKGTGGGAERVGGNKVAGIPRAMIGKAAAVVVVVGVVGVGLVKGGTSSAEPAVQSFLLAWENQQYNTAAGLTTGGKDTVADALAAEYRQLDAADMVLSMGKIVQHGDNATATFDASIDLGSGGLRWAYQGNFDVRNTSAGWKVLWNPAVIVPGLQSGDRLAVLTTMPSRAQIQDIRGRPLTLPSAVYVIGVRPGSLTHPRKTADALATAAGLQADASQIYGQIIAAPSKTFLGLIRLGPAAYNRLRARIAKVPGKIVVRRTERLFDSIAPTITGAVGTETAGVLRQDGVPYRPGATVGLSGLQAAYQRTLAGSATTKVVRLNASGQQVGVLASWSGSQGTAVKTIDSRAQLAADHALAKLPGSAAIVAVQPGTGRVLAVASHQAGGMPAVSPLSGRYLPGQTFTIVSTAALLANGFAANARIPCMAAASVDGVRFSNHPAEVGLGAQPLLGTDFAHACGTAFAGLSMRLNAKELSAAAKSFGIGADWRLSIGSYPGTIGDPVGYGQLAATTVGIGGVRVSPLDMALAAGLVQSGGWYSPILVTKPADPGMMLRHPFGNQVVSSLRAFMRETVTKGAGTAAQAPGGAVYGQIGNSSLGATAKGLRSAWFVGYQGKVAFAVIEFTKSADISAAQLAGTFLHDLNG
jgi:cell division protein FtsI/penicillin-binding protein 2